MPQDGRAGIEPRADQWPVRTSLTERPVWPMPVVVSEVFGEHRLQVTAPEDDHAVQAFSTQGADDPFAYRVRIWRPHVACG